MRLTIVAVGRLKETHWRDACAEYLKRLGRYAAVSVIEVSDRDLAAGAAGAVSVEGADILRALAPGTHAVALDVAGPERSSEDLAAWLEAAMIEGRSDLTFIVGGSAGLSRDVLARASERLSLSRMTLPHQLCRVVLLEQLYRAFRIVRNEPYHL